MKAETGKRERWSEKPLEVRFGKNDAFLFALIPSAALIQQPRIMGADTDAISVSLPSDSVCLVFFLLVFFFKFIFNHFLSNSNEPLLASGSKSRLGRCWKGSRIHFSSQRIPSGLLSTLRSGEEAERSQAVTSDLGPHTQRPLLEVGVVS